MKTIAVTGTSGFLGKRLLHYDKDRFIIVPLFLRDQEIDEIDFRGVDALVHLAGKAHQMQPIDDAVYFNINYELTRELAVKAKKQGVQQFVYISSTKVYGNETEEVLNEQSTCLPTDPYGASKWKAEKFLQSIQTESFKAAIVRPPLVYGPEVKGNMIRLLHLANKNYPLPFANSRNARSMVFVDNLIELINAILDQGASGVFVAGDPEPVPTDKLIVMIRKHLGKSSRLIGIPVVFRKLIRIAKPDLYTRLFGSFVVDNHNTNKQLNFVPPYTTDYGVEQMVRWFKQVDHTT